MCLITEQKKPLKIRKDLIAYKIVTKGSDNTFYPSFCGYDFTYKLGILHNQIITHDNDFESFHDRTAKCMYPDYKSHKYTHVHAGFHGAQTKERLSMHTMWDGEVIVKYIIPKGSLVFKDKTGLIVSNQIKIIKIIK